jgi:hypothetical protein
MCNMSEITSISTSILIEVDLNNVNLFKVEKNDAKAFFLPINRLSNIKF